MRGIRLTVRHPDFVENEDEQRQAFIGGMVRSWKDVMEVYALPAELRAYHSDAGVHVFVPYQPGVREAEMAVAATIAAASLAAVAVNRAAAAGVTGGVMAAYAFDIERDVEDEAAKVLVC